jgi:GR25 family glycosyltransferase involved in LPS biosynthesis
MKSLFFSYDLNVDKAYIIRIKGNDLSERKAKTCLDSCNAVEMDAVLWDAYDGTGSVIVPPQQLKHHPTMAMFKITDHYLVRAEVACALSHISLWVKCIELDKPIVILEHDSIMLKKYAQHQVYNSICYLGSKEQVIDNWPVFKTPVHASEGPNYHFICRAHAYAIDPAVAKNMVAHVLKYGICAPLDIIIRADIFPIHQLGIFAYDNHIDSNRETTILGRPKEGRSTFRNDTLSV